VGSIPGCLAVAGPGWRVEESAPGAREEWA